MLFLLCCLSMGREFRPDSLSKRGLSSVKQETGSPTCRWADENTTTDPCEGLSNALMLSKYISSQGSKKAPQTLL